MYKFSFALVLILCIYQTQAVLRVSPITDTTVSLHWDTITSSLTNPKYVVYDVESSTTFTPLYSTKETDVEFPIVPLSTYNFIVCRNISASGSTFNEQCCGVGCGSRTTVTPVQHTSNIPNLDYGTVVTLDSTKAAFVFPATLGQSSNEYVIEALGIDFTGNATWIPVVSTRAYHTEVSTDIYSVVVPVVPGSKRLYRITRLPFISEVFWYAPPSTNYNNDFNAISVASFPHTGPQVVVSASTSDAFTFDLTPGLPPLCPSTTLLSTRLKLSIANTNKVGGGFVRAYSGDNAFEPNYYLSSPLAQFYAGNPWLDNLEFFIDLDHVTPQSALDTVVSNLGSTWDVVAVIENNSNGPIADPTSFVVTSAELQVAIANPLPPLSTQTVSNVGATTNTNFAIDISQFNLQPSARILGITVRVTFNFMDTNGADPNVLSIVFAKGAVGSTFITGNVASGVCTAVNTQFEILGGEMYSLAEGGFPGIDYNGVNQLYFRFSGGEACITEFSVEASFVSTNPAPCVATTSPSPSPSQTPFPSSISSPSIGVTASASVPTPTPIASPSPFMSANIQPPEPTTPPSRSRTPAASGVPSNVAPPSVSRQASPTRGAAPTTFPSVQPTTIPQPPQQQPIPIVDSNGNVIITISLGGNDGDQTLVVTPGTGISSIGSASVDSPSVNFILLDKFGFEIQPSSRVEICIATEANVDESCLGFLDESRNPPRWRCQDRCLEQDNDGFLCGSTDHFTSFAVLLGGNGDGCGGSNDLIFDEAWKDAALIVTLTVALLCCLLIITIFLAATKMGSRIVRGKEGDRVSRLRDTTSTAGPLVSSDV